MWQENGITTMFTLILVCDQEARHVCSMLVPNVGIRFGKTSKIPDTDIGDFGEGFNDGGIHNER